MIHSLKGMGRLTLSLLTVTLLLGCPWTGNAAGAWSVISVPRQPGAIHFPAAMSVDDAGNLYVAETGNDQIRKRDVQGNWSVLAPSGSALGQVRDPTAVALDGAGNLYVADNLWPATTPVPPSTSADGSRIQRRDSQGAWSVVAPFGSPFGVHPGQVGAPSALAVDAAGSLYVADLFFGIWKRDPQGSWSRLAITTASALAVDGAGNLYVADSFNGQIQKRDAQGNTSVIASYGLAPSQVLVPTAMAADAAGNLYVADIASLWPGISGRIQKRDAKGNWTTIATAGAAPGQLAGEPAALAVDSAGNLSVADRNWTDGGRIQQRDTRGNWSVLAVDTVPPGQLLDPSSVAVDDAGNLYVAEQGPLQQRDARGNWSLLPAESGEAVAVDPAGSLYAAGGAQIQQRDAPGNWSIVDVPGEVTALAVDSAANLYAAVSAPGLGGLLERDAPGSWSTLATGGQALGQVYVPTALAVDGAGNLYVADSVNGRIQKRDVQGKWSLVAMEGPDPGQARYTTGLTVDPGGSLYVADYYFPTQGSAYGRILKRDSAGSWSVLGGGEGSAPGQFHGRPAGLAVGPAGNVYVADPGNDRVQEFSP